MKEKDHEVVFSVPYICVFKGIKPIITPKSGKKNEQRKFTQSVCFSVENNTKLFIIPEQTVELQILNWQE